MLTEVLDYINRGWRVIPIPYQHKRPLILGWQNLTIGVTDVAQYFHDDQPQNVGVLLGSASNLVDVDLDNPKALKLADQFLPPTATFGRTSKPRSHRIYRVTNPQALAMPDNAQMQYLTATASATAAQASLGSMENEMSHPKTDEVTTRMSQTGPSYR